MTEGIENTPSISPVRKGLNQLLRHIRQKVRKNFSQIIVPPAAEKTPAACASQPEPTTFADLINQSSEGRDLIKLLQKAIKPGNWKPATKRRGFQEARKETNQEILLEILKIIAEALKAFVLGRHRFKTKGKLNIDKIKEAEKAAEIRQIFSAFAKRLIALIQTNCLTAQEAIKLIMLAAEEIIAQHPGLRLLVTKLVAEFIAEIISAENANLNQPFSCQNLALLAEVKESKLDELLRIILRNLEIAALGLVNGSKPEINQAAIDLSIETLGDLPEATSRLIKFWHLVDSSSHSLAVKELLLNSLAAAFAKICQTSAGASLCLNELTHSLLNEKPAPQLTAQIIKSLSGEPRSPKANIILKILAAAGLKQSELSLLASLVLLALAASLEIIIDLEIECRSDIASEELQTLKEILRRQNPDDKTPFQKTAELVARLEQEDKLLAEKLSQAAEAVFCSLKSSRPGIMPV